MDTDLSTELVLGMVESGDARRLLNDVITSSIKIAEAALKNLQDAHVFQQRWTQLKEGLREHATVMLLPSGTFTDHRPDLDAVIEDDRTRFWIWLDRTIWRQNLQRTALVQQIVLRQATHVAQYLVTQGESLPGPDVELLYDEFAAPNFYAKTYWLSRIYAGLQLAAGETYVAGRIRVA